MGRVDVNIMHKNNMYKPLLCFNTWLKISVDGDFLLSTLLKESGELILGDCRIKVFKMGMKIYTCKCFPILSNTHIYIGTCNT